MTQEQANVLEKATTTQSKSRIWFEHRAGRITSSNVKRVCTADILNPSPSLIKDICYPNEKKLSTPATQWGLKHENSARDSYNKYQVVRHENFTVTTCGFHVNPVLPFMGASPDGRTHCNCCGAGCLEIKCPYKSLNGGVVEHPCLAKNTPLGLNLKHNHPYYYQIQTHLLVTQTSYCDFFFVEACRPLHRKSQTR